MLVDQPDVPLEPVPPDPQTVPLGDLLSALAGDSQTSQYRSITDYLNFALFPSGSVGPDIDQPYLAAANVALDVVAANTMNTKNAVQYLTDVQISQNSTIINLLTAIDTKLSKLDVPLSTFSNQATQQIWQDRLETGMAELFDVLADNLYARIPRTTNYDGSITYGSNEEPFWMMIMRALYYPQREGQSAGGTIAYGMVPYLNCVALKPYTQPIGNDNVQLLPATNTSQFQHNPESLLPAYMFEDLFRRMRDPAVVKNYITDRGDPYFRYKPVV
jgi:hypothetical protein